MALRTPHSAFRTNSAFHTGFTFVELIAVALILGILTASAVPTFVDSLMRHRVESAARRLKNDLELVRQTATSRSATFSLEFTTATEYSLSNIASLNRAGQPYVVDLAESPYSVRVTSVDFGGTTRVSFNGYGLPSSDGTVVLYAGDHGRQIDVNDQGRVSITEL